MTKAIGRLAEAGLVEDVEGLPRACEPDGRQRPWFHWPEKLAGNQWQDRFQYTRYYRPSNKNPLTPRQLLLYCTLLSLEDTDVISQSTSYLASVLKVDRKTVRAGLKKLEEHELIMLEPTTSSVILREPQQYHWAWFRLIPKAKRKNRLTQHDIDTMVDLSPAKRFVLEMKHVGGYSPNALGEVARLVNVGTITLETTIKLYREAERENTHPRSSATLLLWKMKRYIRNRLKSR